MLKFQGNGIHWWHGSRKQTPGLQIRTGGLEPIDNSSFLMSSWSRKPRLERNSIESEQGTVSSIQCKIRKNRWESIRIDTSFFILFNIIQLNSIISMFNPTGQGPRAPKSKRRLLLFSFLIMSNLLLPRGHDHSCISCISYVIFKKINKI